jgi:hypothetical protein
MQQIENQVLQPRAVQIPTNDIANMSRDSLLKFRITTGVYVRSAPRRISMSSRFLIYRCQYVRQN